VYAYASARQFKEFLGRGISYELLAPPSSKQYLTKTDLQFNPATFDNYPTFDEYVNYMLACADSFPQLCRIDTLGYSANSRLILAAGISGNKSFGEGKPVFLYTSTIHGDETTGYMLMLRLIDYLLKGYGKDSLITRLVNNLEIWINPLANPDGTYFLGGTSVYLAKRFNANDLDLNRNFPDPVEGDHPDSEEWQPETIAMMKFMKQHPPDMSANLHGGAEVVNYPWDTWWVLHADEDWFRMISKNYADTVVSNSSDYFFQFEEGITRGIDWYRVTGGRQDYVTYFLHGREVTLELSQDKMPPAGTMSVYWEYNRKSLLYLMEQCLFGVTGKIVDAQNNLPVKASINIPYHDTDNSNIYSDSLTGTYSRFLKEGTYTIVVEAPGYLTTTVEQVQVIDGMSTGLDISLIPVKSGIINESIPAAIIVAGTRVIYYLEQGGTATLSVYDLAGRQMVAPLTRPSLAGRNEIELCDILPAGTYLFRITCPDRSFSYIYNFNF